MNILYIIEAKILVLIQLSFRFSHKYVDYWVYIGYYILSM